MKIKQTGKILSLLLAVCMVFTMLPAAAFAETGDVDSGTPLEMSGLITAFAALDEDVANRTVEAGTAGEELNLPDTLTVAVTTGSAIAVAMDSDAQEPDAQETETQTTVAVSGWTSDPAYDSNTSGYYTFTPVLDLPDGVTVANGVNPPAITVKVETAAPTLRTGGISLMSGGTAAGTMDIGGETGINLETSVDKLDSNGWAWDAGSATLTLSGNPGGPIYFDATDPVKLVLTTDVTIADTTLGYAIKSSGNLIIDAGSFTLTVSSSHNGTIPGFNNTIRTGGDLTITGGTVNAERSGNSGFTILALGSVTIENGAAVTALYTGANGAGIFASSGGILITGSSTVTATGKGGTNASALRGGTGITISGSANVIASSADGGTFAIFVPGGDLTVSGNASLNSTPIDSSDIDVTGGRISIDTTGAVTAKGADSYPAITASSGTSIQNGTVGITGDVSGNLTVSGGNVTVTGTVMGTIDVTGGTVSVNGATIPPSGGTTGADLTVQGGNGANGTVGGAGSAGADDIQTLSGTAFDSIKVISGNGGDSGGGNEGGKGGNANLTLTAPSVVINGPVLVKTGDDGDNNTGAWCGVPGLRVEGALRTPSITVQSTNGGDYHVYVNTLDVSEDTVIAVSGINAGGNCGFGTVNIADGKTLTIKNADGALLIGTVHFAGNGTGRILIEDPSRMSMNELSFFHNPAFDIPSGTVGVPIAAIDASKGVVNGKFVTTPYTFSAAGLPAGISINASTGVISGTPTAENVAGTATITVTDSDSPPVSKSITINYGAIAAGSGGGTGGDGGGSGNGGGTGGAATPAPTAPSVSGGRATTTVTPTVTKGTATASVTNAQMTSAIEAAQAAAEKSGEKPQVEIKLENTANATSAAATIPQASLQALAAGGVDALTVSSGVGSVTFDAASLATILGAASGDVTISVARADASALPAGVQALVGDRPVYEFSVTSDGKAISQFNGSATVSVPYALGAGEDPNAVIVSYINADGHLEIVTNGRYDAATGTVVFTTTHFSKYTVGYNKISFTDVTASAWYADAVSFLAARGITSGTGETGFSPEATLTRGQFIVMLLQAYEIGAEENPADNFADAGNTYYTGHLAAAKRLGIAGGVGGNKFAPDQAITRQEMFTLLYNALKVIGALPEGDSGKTLAGFSDSGDIAGWAVEAMAALVKSGTVSGSGGKLEPKATTTRAQMAQVLHNLLSK